MKTGIELISEEREKQLSKNRTIENDVRYNNNEQLSICARFLCYNSLFDNEDAKESLIQIGKGQLENWDLDFFKNMMQRDYKERLIIAGALISAELDRISFENEIEP